MGELRRRRCLLLLHREVHSHAPYGAVAAAAPCRSRRSGLTRAHVLYPLNHRTVRIRDRRLGIPYICFMLAILAYNVVILYFQQKYLKQAPVDGVTRLQVRGA